MIYAGLPELPVNLEEESNWIKNFYIHGAYTPPEMESADLATYNRWHTSPKKDGGRGRLNGAYFAAVKRDGTVEWQDWTIRPRYHTIGHNNLGIAVCMAGGKGPDGEWSNNYSAYQRISVWLLYERMCSILDRRLHVFFHSEADKTRQCPGIQMPSVEWMDKNEDLALGYSSETGKILKLARGPAGWLPKKPADWPVFNHFRDENSGYAALTDTGSELKNFRKAAALHGYTVLTDGEQD